MQKHKTPAREEAEAMRRVGRYLLEYYRLFCAGAVQAKKPAGKGQRVCTYTEMLAESYRRLGLGKVVGRPSAGAVIWTTSRMLLTGTLLKLPRTKVATPEGEDLEGTGRAVDADLPLPMGEPARGVDRQLDAAVATLLAQIDGARSTTGTRE